MVDRGFVQHSLDIVNIQASRGRDRRRGEGRPNHAGDFQQLPRRLIARRLPVSRTALGFAGAGTGTSNVVFERVRTVAMKNRMTPAALLGFVMAHELAHLLLPPDSHALHGVMHGDMDVEMVRMRNLWFTAQEAATMVQKLASDGVRATQ